jgi:hypothetical protein
MMPDVARAADTCYRAGQRGSQARDE